MYKYISRRLLAALLLSPALSFADDATHSLLSNLGDKELIEEYMQENGIPNVYDNCRSTAGDFTEGGEGEGECPIGGRDCFYNDPEHPTYDPDGDGKGEPTTDKCIIGVRGNECEDGKCCDFTKKNADGTPDTTSCECVADSGGACKNPADCAECACDAEARGETAPCQKMVLCALKNRAAAHQKKDNKPGSKPENYFCDVVLYQPANSDVPQISSKKCNCDRSFGDGDERGTNPTTGIPDYNQYYCGCCEFKKKNPGKVYNQQCADALANLDCSSEPYASVNSFRGKKLKAPKNCTSVPAPRGASCGHNFFKCAYNP